MNNEHWLDRLDRHGPMLVALVMAALSMAYLYDAYSASSRLHNLIMLVPLTTLAVILAGVITVRHVLSLRRKTQADEKVSEEKASDEEAPTLSAGGVALLMLSLVLYAFLAPYIGFDVASALFIGLCLYIQGDRRWVFMITYSVLFAAAITWTLANVAGAAVPTLII